MQVINSLIFNLLASHKSVVLPDFGTLQIRRKDAIIETSGVIRPPVNHLVFSVNYALGISIIDAVLAELELKREDVEYAYNKWLDEVKKSSKDGNYTIDGVCEISKVADGSYRTKPSDELGKLLNPLTVESINMPKIKKKSGSNQWILWFGIGFVVLWALFALYFFVLAPASKNEVEEDLEFPIIEEVVVDTDTTNYTDTIPLTPTDTVVVEQPMQQPVEQPTTAPKAQQGTGRYCIIGGVFGTEKNALKFIAEESGVSAGNCEIILSPKGLYMVSISCFEIKDDANIELANVKKRIPAAWIYTKP